jgi:phosphatidylglycerol:prolipoprotein diacylglycerol transferase
VHPVLFHLGPLLIPSYGATAALGVLLALFLAQRTARSLALDPAKIWNLCVLALFAALLCSRLLLIALNWSALRLHHSWLLALAMVHHPLLATFGALAAALAALFYARSQCPPLPLRSTADALAAPLALGLAFEQFGALLAGSGYGTETTVHWAITYSHPLAALWSGAPLGVALQPVQAYAALGFLTLSICLLLGLPNRRQSGDWAGIFLLGAAVIVFFTELWRDSIGRGTLLGGALDGPQAAAILMVLAGGVMLTDCKAARIEIEAPND